jgi:hypothetical protein
MESVPPDVPDYNVMFHTNKTGEHRGRYNALSISEVAVVIAGQQFDKWDIVLQSHDENLHKISELHRSNDSLQYPLMSCRAKMDTQLIFHKLILLLENQYKRKFHV